MKIGKVIKMTGASARSIRHYEDKGLIKPARQNNNYREFDEKVIESIQTIQLYLGLGLNTEQIKDILFCKFPEQQEHADKGVYCEELLHLYEAKLSEINSQLNSLNDAKSSLVEKINYMLEQKEE
ncbi:MerR family transcriptional regulator [Paenibacillus sp. SC116]|uniref:MerR family transcriptional regulator n=1 Tax=Paenibacillus sp. SC116 TaxID=2968986 RepID=UPI00215AED39|nr:MerR family transcriptional regulator [Paenibacillus sp. SC116]MCR8843595.1 MerR family transcriptional regulator [Paenibacillus sp. SC116]